MINYKLGGIATLVVYSDLLKISGEWIQLVGPANEAIGGLYILKDKKKQGEQIQVSEFILKQQGNSIRNSSYKRISMRKGIRKPNKFQFN